MFSREGRSLQADQAAGYVPRRMPPRGPGRDLPTERPPRPASLTLLSIRPDRPWTLFKNFHPTFAMGFFWSIVGQGIVTTADAPFAWRLPLWPTHASMPIPWALFYIPALIIGGLFLTFGARFHGGAKAYFAGAGLYAGVWTLIVQMFGFYSMQTAVVSGAGWLLFTTSYSWMRHTQQLFEDTWWAWRYPIKAAAETAQTYEEIAQQRELTEAERWEKTFAKVYGYDKRKIKDPQTGLVREIARPVVRFVKRIDYPNSANVTVHVRLPETGLTFAEFAGKQKLEFLERAFGQADGSIRVEKVTGDDGRDSSRDVWVHLDVVDVLAKMVPMEKDHTPISCYQAFKIGRFADGTPLYLTLAEIHAMIVGVTGAGKTNLLHVIVWQLSRCYDLVLIGMDFKGGAFLRPWLQTWKEKRTRRPIFYWVAVELIEGYRILQALLALCKHRGKLVGGAGHGSKWRASRTHPAVMAIIDELSEATGTHAYERGETPDAPTTTKAAKLVTRIILLGRGVGVWLIMGVQRNTVDMTGSGTGNTQIRLRIAMQVTNPGDASRIFGHSSPDAARLVQRLRHDGSALVQRGSYGSRVMPGKICFFGDDQELLDNAEERCLYIEAHEDSGTEGPAPDLDPSSKAVMVPYGLTDDRWTDMERIGWLFNEASADTDDDDDPDLKPIGGGTGGGTAVRNRTQAGQVRPAASSFLDDWKARRAASAAREAARQAARQEAVGDNDQARAAFDEMTERLAADASFAAAWDAALNADYSLDSTSDEAHNTDSTTVGQDATRDAPDTDATTTARGVRVVADECRAAGERGCSATDIRLALVREGVVTPAGVSAYSRIVRAAMADGAIHQPAPRGKYYARGFGTGRPQ